ncbi:MAG TPA: M48 family metalloprotease, partial [Candidatus Binatia bacterium]
ARQRFVKAGLMYEDRELEEYLNAVAVKVLADRLEGTRTAPRIKIVKDPFLNAFAMSDGIIFFHTGLLARMENEAQLATILGHELAHFINRDAAKMSRNRQDRFTAVKIMQVVLAVSVIGVFADQLPTVWAETSVKGYSKELEARADEDGLRAMVQAGYDPQESVRIFELFKQDQDGSKFKEPFFYGTHPRIEERIANYIRLIKTRYPSADGGAGRRRDSEEFPVRIQTVLLDNALLDLEIGRFKLARAAIERHLERRPDSPRGHFVMGEFYRRSGRNDEAVKEYARAVALDARQAEAHRELGLLYRAQARYDEARLEFERYLVLKPAAVDGPIIRGYIKDSGTP